MWVEESEWTVMEEMMDREGGKWTEVETFYHNNNNNNNNNNDNNNILFKIS